MLNSAAIPSVLSSESPTQISPDVDFAITYFHSLVTTASTLLKMGEVYSTLFAHIHTYEEAVAFLEGAHDSLGPLSVFIDITERIARIASAGDDWERALFVESIDLGLETAIKGGSATYALAVAAIAPPAGLAAFLLGVTASASYTLVFSDYVREWAGEGFDEYVANPDSIFTEVASIALGLNGPVSISGSAQSNLIIGGTENDVLSSGAGGFDTVSGGAGIDTISTNMSGATAGIVWNLRTNSYSGPGNYTGFEIFGGISTGSGNDVIVSSLGDHNESIGTGAGDDTVTVFGGNDFVAMGEGDDLLIIDRRASGQAVYYNTLNLSADGWDGIFTGVQFYDVERFEIYAGASDDNIRTGDGNDRIESGAGNDLVFANGGNDYVDAGAGDDTVYSGSGLDTVLGGAGIDTISTDISDATSAIVWNLLTGEYSGPRNFSGFEIFGGISTGSGNDVIVSSLGDHNESIGTGAGDDTVTVFGGNDFVAMGEGDDLLIIDRRASGQAVYYNTLNLSADGWDGIFTGVQFYDVERFEIYAGASDDNIRTGDGNDRIESGAGNDLVFANGGNDYVDGGTGNDSMTGGLGNDTFIVDSFADVVTENTGEGTDTVRTGIGSYAGDLNLTTIYNLAGDVENLEMTGGAGQVVAGNLLNNLITGTANNDVVVLGDPFAPDTSTVAGADTVNAGGGNDYVFFARTFDAADQVDGGSGFDVVGLLGTYTMTLGAATLANVEKFDAYSSGNAAAPNNYTLTMNDGNVAAGQQLFVTAASLLTNEHLNFNGSAETNGKFLIYGGHGTDTIVGGAGADRIIGGEGADTLTGGAGNDAFQFNLKTDSTTAARDTITDFTAGDRLDFYFFDANDNAGGSQHFGLVGSFTNVAGQLRVIDQGSGHYLVEGDTNGDGAADFSLAVTSNHALGLADFNL